VKKVNNMHLQNVVMQLRKVCSHPFLFDWPLDEWTNQPVVDEQLVDASGKMMVLERLLDELFARGHKVLVFSQFVTMLDVIEVRAPASASFAYSCDDGDAHCRTGRASSSTGHCAA
jgi:ATP-dependent DNA helicase